VLIDLMGYSSDEAGRMLGGIGVYAGASGEATLTDTDEGTEFVIDLG
jgi:hypothetical protein